VLNNTADWEQVVQTAQIWRRELHRQPELGWQETRTAQYIRDRLTGMGIAWRACAETGTLATIAPQASGPHVALRGDIDALPILEQTELPYASEVEGCMHACGHDGHTATLLAVGAWLQAHADALPGPVTLLFQPAEEGGRGAEAMIRAGALEGIDCMYGWHNWPAIPFGKMVCPAGPVMSGNDVFEIIVTGRGGHSSQPELCADPVLAASAIHLNLQQVVSRRIAPQRPAVLSVTSIMAPSADNVTPDYATQIGTIRFPDSATQTLLHAAMEEVAQHTALAFGASAEVIFTPGYIAIHNHAAEAEKMRQSWIQNTANDGLDTDILLPLMASEDFSYYLQQVPGAFALIGANDGVPAHQVSCHSSRYDFNDALIEPVLRLFAELVGVPLPPSPVKR
jgi:amidohydrolase